MKLAIVSMIPRLSPLLLFVRLKPLLQPCYSCPCSFRHEAFCQRKDGELFDRVSVTTEHAPGNLTGIGARAVKEDLHTWQKRSECAFGDKELILPRFYDRQRDFSDTANGNGNSFQVLLAHLPMIQLIDGFDREHSGKPLRESFHIRGEGERSGYGARDIDL